MPTKPEDVTRRKVYFAEDLMAMYHIKKSKAYKIIRDLNEMLNKKGYITVAGRVSATFADEKLALDYKGDLK